MAFAAGARAETLADAIAMAYQTNPALQAQRAQLMGIDETYVQARAAMGPMATLQGTAIYNQNRFGYQSPVESNIGQVQLTITQPLYGGGRNAANVLAARAGVDAARQALRVTEGNVVLAVIQAYADVVRDGAALAVREKNVQVLNDEVVESRARERGGEITRTDVAQAETQLAGERALLSTARGQLQVSRAQYATLVGQNPAALYPPPPLPGLPRGIDDAFRLAEGDNPDLLQAKFAAAESDARVRAARAAYRPAVSASIAAGYSGTITPFNERAARRSVVAQVTVTQPLFTNGMIQSQVRQALDQTTVDRFGIETSRRAVTQNVANAWNQVLVAGDNVAFQSENVRAAQAAFAGMRIEQRAGQRATLDVLITEQNQVNAQILLLNARHDQFVAQATLLRAVGHLEAPDLIASLPKYEPARHFRGVRRRGQAPWTSLARAADAVGAPGVGRRPTVQTPMPTGPSALAPAGPAPRGGLVDSLPLSPSGDAPISTAKRATR